MSSLNSLRLLSSRFLIFTNPTLQIPKTLTLISFPHKLQNLTSISFQNLPTKPQSSSQPQSQPQSSNQLQPISELPPKLQEIIKLFQAVQEPKAKYQQLLFYGQNLTPLDSQFKTIDNKVQGCVSQVWVRAYLDAENCVHYEADSDSVLTKGLAALLVQGLSGRPVYEILRVKPDFAVLLGLQQSLTPSRNNGFLNMLKLMQKKALELVMKADNPVETSKSLTNGVGNSSFETGFNDSEPDSLRSLENGSDGSNSGSNVDKSSSFETGIKDSEPSSNLMVEKGSNSGSRGGRIREKLEREMRPVELEIEDISYQHAGHAGVRGSDGETHFNVRVVSEVFEGKSLVKRHRLIYDSLQDELQSGLHALSIVAKTPSEVKL